MEYKLELVLLPVADVDRAKEFYERIGFRCDVDHDAGEHFRVVQFTPPGSACSVAFGIGITTAEPGSVVGTHLVVTDIEAAHTELTGRGIDVGEIHHFGPAGQVRGPHPERGNYQSFARFADPDGNTWALQEVGHGAGETAEQGVRQLRTVVEAEDYDEAVRFFRDVLGLGEELAVAGPDGARVTILDAGRATLELANPPQKRYIDEVEVGRQVAPAIRLAFEVTDVATTTDRLAGEGASLVAPPTETPWRSLNARLNAPAGVHITLFQEMEPADPDQSA